MGAAFAEKYDILCMGSLLGLACAIVGLSIKSRKCLWYSGLFLTGEIAITLREFIRVSFQN